MHSESNASVATVLELLFEADLNAYVFKRRASNLIRLYESTTFANSPREIVKADINLLLIQSLFTLLLVIGDNLNLYDLLNMVHFKFKIQMLELLKS